MAFSYTGGQTAGGSSGTASVTHGQTINSGNLVVAYLNLNADDQVATPDSDSGSGWTQAYHAAAGGPSATQALFWRVANGSEPSAYIWTLGFSDRWRVSVKVFSCSDPQVDAAANAHLQVGSTNTLQCGAADGEAISDNALSIICGGKDSSNGSSEAYTLADNSYTGVLGDANDQASAVAHRIYTTGTTFSGNIVLTPADAADNLSAVTYSLHISFVEGTASANANPDGVSGTSAVGSVLVIAAPPPPFTLTRVTG